MTTHLRLRSALSVLAALLAAALLAPSACSSGGTYTGLGDSGNPTTGDGGGTDSGTAGDAGADGGDAGADGGDAGALGCTTDKSCGTARYCEKATGNCRDAKACPQGQGNCDYNSDLDYCAAHGCFCDTDDSSCKPIHRACSDCARNVECGDDGLAYDFPADCVAPDAGLSDASACIPRKDHGCPPGYSQPAAGVYCVPAGGRCGAAGGCTADAQCDPHGARPECDALHGVCAAACTFDLQTGSSSCPQGQVCNLDPRLLALAPQEANWAKGRCGLPCQSSGACDSTLACRPEGLDHPISRCTIPSGCLGDVECPDSPVTHSRGYCDLSQRACQTGCRANTDCHAGYLCAGGTCTAETCLQAGGAKLGCNYSQFCCGEPGGPASCAGGATSGQCYDAPGATWCASCSKDADCRGAGFPSTPNAPNLCVPGNNNTKTCWLGCDPNGPSSQCPRSWQCQAITAGCKKQSDCGNQASAHCDNPDGGDGTCTCTADGDCPQDAASGFASFCRQGKCTLTTACRSGCK